MATGQDTILETDSTVDALITKVNNDMTELFACLTEVENARDGSETLLAQIDSLQALIAALTNNGLYDVCTSGTRPAFAAVSNGVLIYETDTENLYVADVTNSKWILPMSLNKYAAASFPSAGATYDINTGTRAWDTTNSKWKIYNGSSWNDLFNTHFNSTNGVISLADQVLKNRFLV
jgi:hypothetical protein